MSGGGELNKIKPLKINYMSKGLLLAAALLAASANEQFNRYEFEASHKANFGMNSRFKQRMKFKKYCKSSKR